MKVPVSENPSFRLEEVDREYENWLNSQTTLQTLPDWVCKHLAVISALGCLQAIQMRQIENWSECEGVENGCQCEFCKWNWEFSQSLT
jgi:hypothetical protein